MAGEGKETLGTQEPPLRQPDCMEGGTQDSCQVPRTEGELLRTGESVEYLGLKGKSQ